MIQNFDLTQKTHILFGAGEENNVGALVAGYSDSCLVVNDGGSYLTQLLERVFDSLRKAGVQIYELSGVKANPLVSKAYEGVALVREKQIGFVLAVGGGSVMDTAKFIAYASYCTDDPLQLAPDTVVAHRVLPHGTIVTLSGTSSECSNCAMIIDDNHEPNVKYALANTALYFDFSIVDPELTYSLPPKQTAAGAMDAISHALEVYLGQYDPHPLMEGYMEGVIKTVLEYGPKALAEPRDYQTRTFLSLAVMMAYNDNLSNGGIPQDWGGHAVENPITTLFNGTHGVTLGIVTPAFLRYVWPRNPRPFVNFAVRCMGVDPAGKDEAAIVEAGAAALEDWLRTMKLPTRLSEIGLKAEQLEQCAELAVPAGEVYRLNKDEVMDLYRLCE